MIYFKLIKDNQLLFWLNRLILLDGTVVDLNQDPTKIFQLEIKISIKSCSFVDVINGIVSNPRPPRFYGNKNGANNLEVAAGDIFSNVTPIVVNSKEEIVLARPSTCVMSCPDWANLPSVVLFDIFQFLTQKDQISASSSCKKWREALFYYPNWKTLNLNTAPCYKEKNIFFVSKAGKICRSLMITFITSDFCNVANLLKCFMENSKLKEFHLLGTGPIELPDFELHFNAVVYPILEHCSALTSLFLSHFVDFSRLRSLLVKHQHSLISLGLGKLHTNADSMPFLYDILSSADFNLEVLQLDGIWVNEELLIWMSDNLPRLRILIFQLDDDNQIGDIKFSVWEKFQSKLPGCEIHVNYFKVQSEDESKMLRLARKITHLRMLYCTESFQEKCMNALMREPSLLHVLSSIWSIAHENAETVFVRQPFVVCAWRFKHLQNIVLSGSKFDRYDLVGMSRLRLSLWIHIADEDIMITEGELYRSLNNAEMKRLVKELSKIKKKPWKTMSRKRFNDPSIASLDREAITLGKVFLNDLGRKE